MLPFHWNYLGIMGQLFGNNGYLLAESENSIMGIKLGIIVSATNHKLVSWLAYKWACQNRRNCLLFIYSCSHEKHTFPVFALRH